MRVWLLLSLLLLSSLVACGGDRDEARPVQIVFRLALSEAAPGFGEERRFETGGSYFLADQPALDSSNVLMAEVAEGAFGHEVRISLDDEGTEAFARLTTGNVGKHVAILVDGKLVSVPRIAAPIRQGRAVISGNFDEEEARRIAEGILVR